MLHKTVLNYRQHFVIYRQAHIIHSDMPFPHPVTDECNCVESTVRVVGKCAACMSKFCPNNQVFNP